VYNPTQLFIVKGDNMNYSLKEFPLFLDTGRFGLYLNVHSVDPTTAGLVFRVELSVTVYRLTMEHDFTVRRTFLFPDDWAAFDALRHELHIEGNNSTAAASPVQPESRDRLAAAASPVKPSPTAAYWEGVHRRTAEWKAKGGKTKRPSSWDKWFAEQERQQPPYPTAIDASKSLRLPDDDDDDDRRLD
jgi:hypothetical protein